jgi:hypothetical protein
MKKVKLFIAALIVIITASSCAMHWGMMTGNASLSANNFKIVKMVTGTSKTTKFLGIGGLGKEGLVLEAKKDMLMNNPLKDGQALSNVTVDIKTSYLILVVTEKATVTADIVEFK